MTLDVIIVKGTQDPSRFAGFPDLESLLSWLQNQYGGKGDEQHDSQRPIDENTPVQTYEIHPDTETLIASPEFQKLNQAIKTRIFQDEKLTRDFAKFIRDGGTFVVDNSISQALYVGTIPPKIIIKSIHINPIAPNEDGALFVLAHELYHHIHRTPNPLDREKWAMNETMASLLAFQVLKRLGIRQIHGATPNVQFIFDIIFKSPDEDTAKAGLMEYFRRIYPGA